MKQQVFSKTVLFLTILFIQFNLLFAQSPAITNVDGTPLMTRYCWTDSNYAIAGNPAGGTFSGCGITEANGQWYFNPVLASQGISVFPYQCSITYTTTGGSASTTQNILVWKPVVITPPLQDSFTCNGAIHLEAYTLYAGAYEYQWTPAGPLNRPDTSITNGFVNQTTTFVITARDYTSNCVGSDTVTIQKYPMPDVTIRSDTTILARGEVSLWATGGATYEWTPGYWLNNAHIRDPIANPQAPVTYTVTATNEYGCSDSDSVYINIIEGLQLPTAFTPNGDGRNDVFKLVNYGYEEVMDFSIYNRWGQRVFITYDGTQGWDGTYNGRPADIGTYYYNIRLRLRNGTEQLFRGDLALLR